MWNPQGIYNQYMLRTPAIVVGGEAVKGLYNYPCAKVAVIHGSSIVDEGLLEETFKRKDIRFFERSWNGEPDLESLSGTMHELENFKPDTIIAMGGGSVIDGGKLCRMFLEIPYYKLGVTRLDGDAFTTNFIAIPSTVGSGAEVSSAAVYVDKMSSSKQMIVMHEMQPDVIVYDDRYVRNMPTRLLCASALDAFAHIVEGYVSNVKNVMAEIMAEEGLTVLVGELEKLISKQPDDIDFYRLMYAGYIGGIVQNHCIVGAAHAVAHQLTGFGFSHGEAVALLLPAIIRLNMEDTFTSKKYERIALRAGFKNTDEMLDFIKGICSIGEIDSQYGKLKDILKANMFKDRFVENIRNDRGGMGNPIEINAEYIGRLLVTI